MEAKKNPYLIISLVLVSILFLMISLEFKINNNINDEVSNTILTNKSIANNVFMRERNLKNKTRDTTPEISIEDVKEFTQEHPQFEKITYKSIDKKLWDLKSKTINSVQKFNDIRDIGGDIAIDVNVLMSMYLKDSIELATPDQSNTRIVLSDMIETEFKISWILSDDYGEPIGQISIPNEEPNYIEGSIISKLGINYMILAKNGVGQIIPEENIDVGFYGIN